MVKNAYSNDSLSCSIMFDTVRMVDRHWHPAAIQDHDSNDNLVEMVAGTTYVGKKNIFGG